MAIQRISSEDADVTALLDRASEEPVILQSEGRGDFALLPLEDEILDLLLERSPRFLEECRQIRECMKRGDFVSHDQVRRDLEASE